MGMVLKYPNSSQNPNDIRSSLVLERLWVIMSEKHHFGPIFGPKMGVLGS